jgi:TolB-like protein
LADVFISYARSDEAVARRVAKALQASGLSVWWDADLPAHRDYSDIIERNLTEAKAVVVLWSKAAAASQWVKAEADFARNARKLAQAQLDGSLPPMPFNQIQCADLRSWRGRAKHLGWTKLEGSVVALLSGEEPSGSEHPAGRWDRLERYRWPIAALVILLLAAAVYFYAFGVPGEQRKPVVAVLPFRSLDPHDAALVAGMWEDTRSAIGRNPQLIVLGPNTVQQLADKGEEASKKAADYVLEASVRAAGDKVRVSADLVRTSDGEQLWAQDFDRKLDDVFALQSEIASEIEGRIRGRLAERGGVTPEHIATSGEAYALYADARAKIRKRDYGPQAAAAMDELRQVVRMDPNYAPAWASMAVVTDLVPPSRQQWKVNHPSEAFARKAIELAPNLAAGHSALAFALGRQGPVAKAELERAVELDPSDYEAWNWLSNARRAAGDKDGGVQAVRRAVEIEPLFWPAVLNLYEALKESGDERGIKELLDRESRLGGKFLAASIEVDDAYNNGRLAEAANIGLAHWNPKRADTLPSTTAGTLWTVLLQLGFFDEAARLGGPDFAPYLWRNDPRGLDLMESHHIDPRTFFKLDPLTENAGRVYLLSGRGRKLANLYLSLKLSPEGYFELAGTDGPDHFLLSAPLVAVALKQNGHAPEAAALLSFAADKAKGGLKAGTPASSVLLARVYAVQGRKDEALSLLASAVSRGWLPEPPALQVDLHFDPALASLQGNARFEALRNRIIATIARERARVDPGLLRQFNAA